MATSTRKRSSRKSAPQEGEQALEATEQASLPAPPALREPWSPTSVARLDFSDLRPALRATCEDVVREEGFWDSSDNLALFWHSWSTTTTPRRGAVIIVHGYVEYCMRYDHVAVALVRAGYNVLAMDMRGHGRSQGRRGYVERYAEYVQDVAQMQSKASARWPDLPLFVLGHSNGGLIALRYALGRPANVAGFVITSPLLGFKVQIPVAKAIAGELMSRVWPTLALPSEIDASDLTHVDDVVAQYRLDPLVFKVATARWFTEARQAFGELLVRARELDQKFLFLVAGGDRIVDPAATERLFHAMGSKDRELEVFPDLSHEVLNEGCWADLTRQALVWMDARRPHTT